MNDHHISGIYAITDPNLLSTETQLLSAVDDALSQGVRIIQYRDKTASNDQKLARAKLIKQLCDQYQAVSIINDSLELAIASNAHGVHLGQTDGSIEEARKQLKASSIIGVTCHDDLALAQQAEKAGADYVAFGRFFPSETKPHAKPADIRCLVEAKTHLSIPIVAIGGINPHNMSQIIDAGADSLAVIHAIFGQPNTKAAASELVTRFRSLT